MIAVLGLLPLKRSSPQGQSILALQTQALGLGTLAKNIELQEAFPSCLGPKFGAQMGS